MFNIVLIGVGGAGLSGLVNLFHDLGYKNLIGIDATESEVTKKLQTNGVCIIIGHGKYQVKPDDIVIYSDIETIKNGPEVQQAFAYVEERIKQGEIGENMKKQEEICSEDDPKNPKTQTPKHIKSNFPFPYTYNQFLGEISKWFVTLAIAGSKGKSTTTAMMMYGLRQVESERGKVESEGEEKGEKKRKVEKYEKQANDFMDFTNFPTLQTPFGFGIVGALVPDFGNKNILINETYKIDLKAIFDRMLRGKGILDYTLVKKYLFVIEACEYKEHFLLLDTDYAIITNTYRDHRDYFPTYDSYLDAYRKLVEKTRYSTVMLSEGETSLIGGKSCGDREGFIDSSTVCEKGKTHLLRMTQPHIVLAKPQKFTFNHIFGEHNHLAGSLVVKMLEVLQEEIGRNRKKQEETEIRIHHQIAPVSSQGGSNLSSSFPSSDSFFTSSDIFADFRGLWRRMELLGQTKLGANIYSDYAHTPESVNVGLQAIRGQYPDRRLVCIFQPHQATRVLAGWDTFHDALQLANEIIIYKLYTAREKVTDFDFTKVQVTSNKRQDVAIQSFDDLGHVFAAACGGQYVTEFVALQKILAKADKDTIVVVFTAGDVDYQLRKTMTDL